VRVGSGDVSQALIATSNILPKDYLWIIQAAMCYVAEERSESLDARLRSVQGLDDITLPACGWLQMSGLAQRSETKEGG
jgi:hypothetical protein